MQARGANRFIQLLFVSGCREDREKIQSACASLGTQVRTAGGFRDGSVALCHYRVNAIICDEALSDGNWRDFLSLIAPFTAPPRLVVCSNRKDEIRAEIAELGGFGVLEKPIIKTAVARMIRAIADRAAGGRMRTEDSLPKFAATLAASA
jgi:DNA-binding response OmpR family regulator